MASRVARPRGMQWLQGLTLIISPSLVCTWSMGLNLPGPSMRRGLGQRKSWSPVHLPRACPPEYGEGSQAGSAWLACPSLGQSLGVWEPGSCGWWGGLLCSEASTTWKGGHRQQKDRTDGWGHRMAEGSHAQPLTLPGASVPATLSQQIGTILFLPDPGVGDPDLHPQ